MFVNAFNTGSFKVHLYSDKRNAMKIVLYAAVITGAFMFMEFYAWFMHKYVMHGFLWVLHEDHHQYHESWLEKNDIFTLFFSSIAILLIYCGTTYAMPFLLVGGIGVTLYGICYFFVS
jgi:beta-carotene 3-hydroxylase